MIKIEKPVMHFAEPALVFESIQEKEAYYFPAQTQL